VRAQEINHAEAKLKERQELLREFKLAVTAYLGARLRS
jgi:hypothetical protein